MPGALKSLVPARLSQAYGESIDACFTARPPCCPATRRFGCPLSPRQCAQNLALSECAAPIANPISNPLGCPAVPRFPQRRGHRIRADCVNWVPCPVVAGRALERLLVLDAYVDRIRRVHPSMRNGTSISHPSPTPSIARTRNE